MSTPLRRLALAVCALLMSACAHEAALNPPHDRIVTPITHTAPEGQNAPPKPATTGAPPSLTMPAEWQHHNGEDYDDLFDRMRAGFAFDEVQEPAIDQQLSWYEHNPDYMERVFQRSQRYMYHIITEVEARGMPTEFALLPVVESAYEPFAYSTSNAAGLWQFIPGTGVRFGLKQTWWYDGRRDVIESTRAALDYLQALHDEFGDWLLAIASYNVGEAYVERAIAFNKSVGKPADFWHINLPAETRAYVPKLLAMKRLMAEPERYGLEFAPLPNQPYFAVIDTDSQIDLKVVAQLAGTSYDEIVALNPGYNRWATDPVGPQRMLVPIDNADAYEAALKTLAPEDRVRYIVHEVGRRETLPTIARQYGTTAAVIQKINNLAGPRVTAGQSLKIPEINTKVADKVLLAASRVDRPEADTSGGRKQRQIVYRVRAGETLSSIARRNNMPVGTLARLNNMGSGDSLLKGQRLVVKAGNRSGRDEGVQSGRRVLYTVRRGDTIFSISKQFQVSVAQLKTWNGINQRHQIRAGQRLVMYVESNRAQG
jgi:membrane-bound lytic murein transglycosylase D